MSRSPEDVAGRYASPPRTTEPRGVPQSPGALDGQAAEPHRAWAPPTALPMIGVGADLLAPPLSSELSVLSGPDSAASAGARAVTATREAVPRSVPTLADFEGVVRSGRATRPTSLAMPVESAQLARVAADGRVAGARAGPAAHMPLRSTPVSPPSVPLGGSGAAESAPSGRAPVGESAGFISLHAMRLLLGERALYLPPLATPTGVVFDVPVPPGRVATS